MKMKKYIFWIRSSRGTDSQQVVSLDSSLRKKDIKSHLEQWCSSFGAWDHGDNIVEYGWTVATKTNLRKLGRYNEMRIERGHQIDKLIKKQITVDCFNKWLKKNKKKRAFPFR